MDSLFFKEHFVKISNFFSTSSTNSQKFQFSQNSLKQVQIRSTWVCFDHISLIRPQNHTLIFFMDSLFFKKHSVKISKFFSTGSTGLHPVQSVNRVSLYGALILVILEPNSYMAWAHGL